MLRTILLNSQVECVPYLINEMVSIPIRDKFDVVCPYIRLENENYTYYMIESTV